MLPRVFDLFSFFCLCQPEDGGEPPLKLIGTWAPRAHSVIGQGFQIGFSAAVPTLEFNYFSRKSAHFCIWSFCPQGIIGTDEVEFFGEPSMRRSE